MGWGRKPRADAELLSKRSFLDLKKGRYIHSPDAGKALIHLLPEMAVVQMHAHWESVFDANQRKQCRYQILCNQLVGTLYQLIERLSARRRSASEDSRASGGDKKRARCVSERAKAPPETQAVRPK